MNINDLSDDLKKQALSCRTLEDVVELAKSGGIELSDVELEQISGGKEWYECSDFNGCPADFRS